MGGGMLYLKAKVRRWVAGEFSPASSRYVRSTRVAIAATGGNTGEVKYAVSAG
jgi:hypothetical protein